MQEAGVRSSRTVQNPGTLLRNVGILASVLLLGQMPILVLTLKQRGNGCLRNEEINLPHIERRPNEQC